MDEKLEATHRLKRNYSRSDSGFKETYLKGTLVRVVRGGGNVAFLDKDGKVLKNKKGACAFFTKSLFYPLSGWFEKID